MECGSTKHDLVDSAATKKTKRNQRGTSAYGVRGGQEKGKRLGWGGGVLI